MEDDPKRPPEDTSSSDPDVDNTIDDLLPLPEESEEATLHQSVDGPEDSLLPIPVGEPQTDDDASTSEELETDTSNDGVDDIIPVGWSGDGPEPITVEAEIVEERTDDVGGDWRDETSSPDAGEIDNGPVTQQSGETGDWAESGDAEGITDEAETETWMDRLEIDEGSDSAGATTVTAGAAADASPHPIYDDETGGPLPTDDGVCSACGHAVGHVAYCPYCGAEQAPRTRLGAVEANLLAWTKPALIRGTLLAALLLVLLSLLADSGTTALIVTAAVMPVVIVMRVAMHIGKSGRRTLIELGMMALGGIAIGLVIAWLGSRTVANSWYDLGVFNYGAAGFGGVFADSAGAAPFMVWMVCGILLPLVALLTIGGLPYLLRTATGMPMKETTGMLLSSGVAAGYMIASAVFFYRPMYDELAPMLTTSHWTLMIVGMSVIRPIIWVFSGAMLGTVVWRYMRTTSLAQIAIPAAVAIGIPIVHTLLTVAIQPAGLWSEVLMGLVFAAATVYLFMRMLGTALKNSR